MKNRTLSDFADFREISDDLRELNHRARAQRIQARGEDPEDRSLEDFTGDAP